MIQRFKTYWNLYERIWLFSFCAIAVLITLLTGDNLFGFIVFLSGVLCVILAAKGSILNYPAGILNTVGYAWIALQNGLYGEVGLNMLFYLPMNVIGVFLWRKHMESGVVTMRKLSVRGIWFLVISCVAAIAGLGFLLSCLDGQNSPYIDSATNILSIAATILMLRRYREQWACYIVLNVLSVIMWSVRAAAGSPEGALMIVMWTAYLINAFYGWHNWSKGVTK